MSLYNMINGVSPFTFLLLPMLFEEHANQLPRFRDLFVADDKRPDNDHIILLTRVGGGNRNAGYNEEKYTEHPCFIETYDWSADSTYGVYVFAVPPHHLEDYDRIMRKDFKNVSEEYKQKILSKLGVAKATFEAVFY